jgi:hypothetical protein
MVDEGELRRCEMLNTILISASIGIAVLLCFFGLFARSGRAWNGDLGSGVPRRRRR